MTNRDPDLNTILWGALGIAALYLAAAAVVAVVL